MEKIVSKCKNCGSELWFNPKQGCLTCKYCESNYFLPKKKDDAVLVRQYNAGFHPNQLNQSLMAYKCQTCHNVYYMSSEEKSKKCTNCGNSSSELVKDSSYSADGIIPFKLSKEEASKCFEKFLKEKAAVPKELKQLALNKKLMGVFIPVWNFSFNLSVNYSANATELKKDSYGMFYGVSKPVFGDEMKRYPSLDESANKQEDPIFLELFDQDDYINIIPYLPEYTYGFRVDAADKSIHDYAHEIIKKAKLEYEREIKKKIISKYKEVSDVQVDARADDVFFNFTYVPVYVNNFTYHGKTYKTYISGTTGKVVGKTPKSRAKKIANVVKGVLLIAVLAAIGYWFFGR